MDNMYADVHFFSVPNRLVWDNWKKFMGEQKNPGDSTNFIMPIMTAPAGGYGEQSIYDYMGLPTKIAGYTHTSLPLRCVNLIWNEWFRDENLQNSVTVHTSDSADASTDYTLLDRGKRKDYFTSALPWAQKGTAVSVPIGGSAPVVSSGSVPTFTATDGKFTNIPLGVPYNNTVTIPNPTLNLSGFTMPVQGSTGYAPTKFGTTSGLIADLSTATATTINALRQAFQIQRLYNVMH